MPGTTSIDAAFTIRIADAQDAKDALGINRPIDLALIDNDVRDGAWAWIDLLTEPWQIVLKSCLPPAFASWCLWHELGHARQAHVDYGDDVEAFLYDYGKYTRIPFQDDENDGETEVALRRFNLAPWEAEAHLTAWDNRMRVLTGPGSIGASALAPPHAVGFMDHMCFTVDEMIEAGLDYRHGIRP